MPRCCAKALDFRIIPGGGHAPLEFLTGFTWYREDGGVEGELQGVGGGIAGGAGPGAAAEMDGEYCCWE